MTHEIPSQLPPIVSWGWEEGGGMRHHLLVVMVVVMVVRTAPKMVYVK